MTNPNKRNLNAVLSRISNKLQQDVLVSDTLHDLRSLIDVDRVVLYYFYVHWKGQVTFEALSNHRYSIIGSTGADECFKSEYAELYLLGRVRGIDDIETANINSCHRDFLRELKVRSNLVAPVIVKQKLWGLVVAHHCQSVKVWQNSDIDLIRHYSAQIADAPSIMAIP